MGGGQSSGTWYGYDSSQNKDLQQNLQSPEYTGKYNHDDVTSPDLGNQSEPTPAPGDDSYKKYGGLMEQIKNRIDNMSAADIKRAADMCYGTWRLLYDANESIGKASDDLYQPGNSDSGWSGPAADAFMSRGPGATLKSMNDWQNAMLSNYYGLDAIASAVTFARSEIQTAYETYRKQLAASIQDIRDNHKPTTSMVAPGMYSHSPGLFNSDGSTNHAYAKDNPDEVNDYMNEVADKAYELSAPGRTIEHNLAQTIYQNWLNWLLDGTAGVYEGPGNSIHDPAHPNIGLSTGDVPTGGPTGTPGAPPQLHGAPPNAGQFNKQMQLAYSNDQQQLQKQLQDQQQQLQNGLNDKTGDLQQNANDLQNQSQNLPGAPPVVPVAPVTPNGLAGQPPSSPTAPYNGARPGLDPQQVRNNQSAFAKPPMSRPGLNGANGLSNRPPMAPSMPRKATKKPGNVLGRRGPSVPGEGGEEGMRGGNPTSRTPASPAMRGGRRGSNPNEMRRHAPTGRPRGEDLAAPPDRPTTSPVLNSRAPTPHVGDPELGGRPGSSRPGSTPPVLNNKAKPQRSREEHGPSARTGTDRPDSVFAGPPPVVATPVVNAPTSTPNGAAPTRFDEVPEGLRGGRPLTADRGSQRLSSRPPTEAELTARRRQAAKKKEDERLEQIFQEYLEMSERMAAGEQPWTVETPGGPVIANRPNDTKVQEPGPALGAAG